MKSQKSKPLAGASFSAGFSLKFLRACGALLPAVVVGVAAAPCAFADDAPPEPAAPAAETAAPSAAETPEKVAKLPTTVVVASRTEVELDKVSPSVSVVSGEELASQQVRSVADALSREAGITIFGGVSTGTPTSLSMRGTSSQQTVVMLDGRRMNSGIYGQYGLNTLTTDNLASVQILRGSASTLYGSAAIGGAIDLRTRNGLDYDKPTGSIWGEGGSWGTRTFGAEIAGNTDGVETDLPSGLGFSAGLSYSASDGYNWNNDYEQTAFLPRLDWEISDKLSLNLVGRVFQKDYGCPGDGISPYTKSYTDREKDTSWMISPELVVRPLENLQGKILYSYSEYKSEGYVGGLVDNENKAQQVSMQWDWQALENLLVSAGYDFIQDDAFARGDPSWGGVPASLLQYSNSVWANAQWELVKDLKLSAGVRYTDTNKYGDRTTYELAAQYRFDATGTSVFAKISTGFRTPSYTDLSPNWGNVAADSLEAEKSTSYEIGVKQELFDKQVNVGATLFLIDTKDKFVADYSVYPAVLRNIDEARSNGVELTAEWAPEAISGLRVYGNATFQDAWDRKTDERLKLVPQFMGTLGAEWTFAEDFTVGASGTFVKGREGGQPTWPYAQADMGDYFVARVYGSWVVARYADGREKFSVFGRLENALDREYDDYNIGYEAPGFGAFAGAKLSF